jgi:hypothetical protein
MKTVNGLKEHLKGIWRIQKGENGRIWGLEGTNKGKR